MDCRCLKDSSSLLKTVDLNRSSPAKSPSPRPNVWARLRAASMTEARSVRGTCAMSSDEGARLHGQYPPRPCALLLILSKYSSARALSKRLLINHAFNGIFVRVSGFEAKSSSQARYNLCSQVEHFIHPPSSSSSLSRLASPIQP